MKEIKALTGIRFFAAFYVFLFHLHSRVPLSYLPWQAKEVVSQGAIGVNLFFMLSGFLLAFSHFKDFPFAQLRDGSYTGKFLFKRFARIYPVYLVALLMSLVVSVWLRSPPGFLVIGANLTFLQAYFPSIAMLWYGGGAWSIANEIFFYLCFPILLPLLLRISQRTTLFALLALCAIVGIIPGALFNLYPDQVSFTFVYAFPLCRVMEFTAGIITSVLVFRFQWRVASWVALGVLAGAALYLAYAGPVLHLQGFVIHNLVMIPVIALVLVAVAQEKLGLAFAWIGKEPWVYLGKISYCFYMVQIPLSILLDNFIERGEFNKSRMIIGPIAFVVSLIGGAMLHHLVEVPAHRKLMHFYLKDHA